MEHIIRFLSRPSVIKFLAVFDLSLARMFKGSRRYYRTLRASEQGSSDGLELNSFEEHLLYYFTAFDTISESIMIYKIAIKLFPFDKMINYFIEPKIPARCYLFGKFSPRFVYIEELVMLWSLNHLGWRLAQRLRPQNPQPLCLIFMLLGSHQKVPEAIHNTIFSYEIVYPQSQTQDLIVRLTRPNRTPEAHRRLVHRYVILTMITHTSMSFYYLAVVLTIVVEVLSDEKYLIVYPGCSPELQQSSDTGKLGRFLIYWSWHKLLVTPFDIMQSLIFWLDSLISVFYVVSLLYVFDYDLELYWNDLERQLHVLYHKIQRHNLMTELSPLYSQGWRKFRYRTSFAECDILELQVGLADFFGQFKAAGTYSSHILTMMIIVWVSGIGAISYLTSLVHDGVPTFVSIYIWSAMAIVAVTNYSLCTLNRRIQRSHRMLSSIIAHDNSRFKDKFIVIQEYFTRHEGAYKIFGSIPLTSSTFLTLSGWTLSCFAILQSMAKQMSAKSVQNPLKD